MHSFVRPVVRPVELNVLKKLRGETRQCRNSVGMLLGRVKRKRAATVDDIPDDALKTCFVFASVTLPNALDITLVCSHWRRQVTRTRLSLRRREDLGVAPGKVTDQVVQSLVVFTGLQHLDLSWCINITDAGVQALSMLTSLKHLNLWYCRNITDTGVQSLAVLSGLRHLNLCRRIKVTDAGVQSLAFSGLMHLNLCGWGKITNTGVRSLSVITSLQQLDLTGCENITDAGVQTLSLNIGLQNLYLCAL